MSNQEELRRRLQKLLDDARRERDRRRQVTQVEMAEFERRLKRYQEAVRVWVDQAVLPRLKTLTGLFANSASPVVCQPSDHVSVLFHANEEIPVDARIEVGFIHDPAIEHVTVVFKVSIIPILIDYEGEASIELGVDPNAARTLENFLDARIERFVSDYLRLQDPDSPYQRDLLVTDPVCGMTIQRAESVGSVEFDGRTYYFCVQACRDRFEANPQAFVR
ncbi:MAG: YHS domain-containing protein [Planctomycetes bacterium]|nr:YHS domain-containing protein [Planctomycetota bacterium]MBI3848433.1 YHS domain-containing protein [Planctomycetota bacterium]